MGLLLLGLCPGWALFGAERAPVRNAGGIYEIADAEQLCYWSRHYGSASCPSDGHYALTADIDLSDTPDFEPVRGPFLGRFDGRHHAIRHLTIRRPDRATVGFFCTVGDAVTQAVVENLALVDVYVLGRNTVGAIAGALCGTIRNCYVSGEVHALMHCAGGIAGRLPEIIGQKVSPRMQDCFCSAAVICEGESDSQGGLAGRLLSENGLIENCIATGEVVGHDKTGGAVGQIARTGVLRRCVAANRSVSAAPQSRSAGRSAGAVEPGSELVQTIVWEASGLMDHPEKEGVTLLSAASLVRRSGYEAAGWRFDGNWRWRQTATGEGYPVLNGFAELPYAYDYSWSDPQPSVRIAVQCDTNRIVLRITCPSAAAYCIRRADRGLPDQVEWSTDPEMRFDGLDPATAYPFCYKIQEPSGRESRWYRLTANTRYRASTDKTPRNILAAVSSNPARSFTFGWTTADTTLTEPTVWIVPEADSARWQEFPHRGTSHTEPVRGTVNKRLYDGIRSFHRVKVDSLEPDTRYLYRVGDAAQGTVSAFRSVSTAPDCEGLFRFAYIADLQVDTPRSAEAVRRTCANILERMPDPAFLYLAGDMTENGFNYTQWDRFFEAGDTLLRHRFAVPVQGNHDTDGDLFNHFPVTSAVEGIPFVYSFDYGCAHFIVLNTQYDRPDELDRQIAWMETDLAAHRRHWNIVLLHKAIYAATDHVDDADIDRLRARLAPRLEAWGIDAVLMGHDHSFTRSFVRAGRNGRIDSYPEAGRQVFRAPDTPLYMVNGTGGISKWYYKIRYDASNLIRVSPDYEFVDKTSADYDRSLHEQSFTLVEVTPQTLTLDTWFFQCDPHDMQGYRTAPYLFDAVRIVKP